MCFLLPNDPFLECIQNVKEWGSPSEVPVPIFPEMFQHFPLSRQIKILIFFVPYSPKLYLFPVPFILDLYSSIPLK